MRTETVPRFWTALIASLLVAACGTDDQQPAPAEPLLTAPADVFVHMFEWHWNDIAAECEDVLGPAGYAAVQISPPQEHIQGPQWWTRYQPVSYKIESRSGTRKEFAEMVQRCANAGVDIYADALINHMAGFDAGSGVAGSPFSEYKYAVPYGFDDFHHCGRYDDDRIRDYQDLWEVQNCQLGTLDDLDTGKPSVQDKIAAYLNDLLSLGVAGFRMDAVKHVAHDEVTQILRKTNGDPFIFQEVIDRGNEPVKARNYLSNGMVTEFRYASAIISAFEFGELEALTELGSDAEWLPADQAIVFVDNHDSQRSHLGNEILNYKDGARYDLAVAFMLAYPYGYPLVMSSYRFEDDGQGPPGSSPHDEIDGCGKDWVCEHRRPAIANMVAFRKATDETEVVNWQVSVDRVISFGRDNVGHVLFNVSEQAIEIEVPSSLPSGRYCDVIANGVGGEDCAHARIDVDDGVMTVSMEPLSVIAILAGS